MKHFSLIAEEQLVSGVWKVCRIAGTLWVFDSAALWGEKQILLDHLQGLNPKEELGCLADKSLHMLSLKLRY